MFRKHQGSQLNQHIRVIQRLVPGRHHFIHNPIHLSSSISPLVGPCTTEWSGTFANYSPFFWLVLILDWTLARVYNQTRLSLSATPPFFAPCFSFLFPKNISCAHTLPLFLFLYLSKIDKNTSKRYFLGLFLPEIRKNKQYTFFSFLARPWGNNFRNGSLDDYQKPFNALGIGLIVKVKELFQGEDKRNLRDYQSFQCIGDLLQIRNSSSFFIHISFLNPEVSPRIDISLPLSHFTDKNTRGSEKLSYMLSSHS